MGSEPSCLGGRRLFYAQGFKDPWEVEETWAHSCSSSRWRPKEILEDDDRESKKNRIVCLLVAEVGVVAFKHRIN